MTPTATASLAGMEAAARFTSETTLASWVVVRREPGVVRHAQKLAASSNVNLVRVDIGAATIALRFTIESASTPVTKRPGGAGATPRPSGTTRALVSRAWQLLRRPSWRQKGDRPFTSAGSGR